VAGLVEDDADLAQVIAVMRQQTPRASGGPAENHVLDPERLARAMAGLSPSDRTELLRLLASLVEAVDRASH
jgi:hypothetical protein